MTVQDLLDTNRFQRQLSTPTVIELLDVEPVSRAVFLRLDYRFCGRGKASRDPGFEYDNPSAAPG